MLIFFLSTFIVHVFNTRDTTNLAEGVKKNYSVTRVKVHENYDDYRLLNDIAIIKLSEQAYWD
jgi:hypothetical protein